VIIIKIRHGLLYVWYSVVSDVSGA